LGGRCGRLTDRAVAVECGEFFLKRIIEEFVSALA
jgi:hypothetical protein